MGISSVNNFKRCCQESSNCWTIIDSEHLNAQLLLTACNYRDVIIVSYRIYPPPQNNNLFIPNVECLCAYILKVKSSRHHMIFWMFLGTYIASWNPTHTKCLLFLPRCILLWTSQISSDFFVRDDEGQKNKKHWKHCCLYPFGTSTKQPSWRLPIQKLI